VTLRIIGCGNCDRGDDAAGVLVACRLHALGVETPDLEIIEQGGDSFSLMDCWIGCERVILVDATAPSGTPGQIRIWNANADWLPEDIFPCSTHAFGVREAVELARVVTRLPQTLLVYGIEGKQFSFGAPLCPEVGRAVETVAQQILELARTLTSPAPSCAEPSLKSPSAAPCEHEAGSDAGDISEWHAGPCADSIPDDGQPGS
jgi:hydrogenase maturation protease